MLLELALMLDTLMAQLQRLEGYRFCIHILLLAFVIYSSMCIVRAEIMHIWILLTESRIGWTILHAYFFFVALDAILIDRHRIFYYIMASHELREFVIWPRKEKISFLRVVICILACVVPATLLHLFGVVFYLSFELAVLLFDSETETKQILESQFARASAFGLLQCIFFVYDWNTKDL